MSWKDGEPAIIPPPDAPPPDAPPPDATPPDANGQRLGNGQSPGHRRRKPKRRFPPEVLSPEEIAALMDACSDGPAGVRNRALITVLYRAGLRINEALALRPKDLDPRTGAIRVLFAKGGRDRTVGMDGRAFEVLGHWLAIRAARLPDGVQARAPVFCMLDGKPLADGYIRVLFPRLGRLAGIAKRVHAHGLRHTHAAELRAEGVDVGIISKQLGHRTIATTARYLDHIAPWSVVEAMMHRQW